MRRYDPNAQPALSQTVPILTRSAESGWPNSASSQDRPTGGFLRLAASSLPTRKPDQRAGWSTALSGGPAGLPLTVWSSSADHAASVIHGGFERLQTLRTSLGSVRPSATQRAVAVVSRAHRKQAATAMTAAAATYVI